jgi:hypothetical protein
MVGTRICAAAAILFLATSVAPASTGKLVDPDRKPIEGARVCYMLGEEAEGLCVQTEADGAYQLPGNRSGRIRITADGFLTHFVPAKVQVEPIVMDRAATLRVLLKNTATGETIAGEVFLVNPAGRRHGPLPVSKAGLAVGKLPPGKYRVLGKIEGFVQHRSLSADLVGGETSEVVVEVVPSPPPGAVDTVR